MIDVVCLGIIVADNAVREVDKMPDPGKLEQVREIGLYTGGCAVNTGIDLAKIGLRSAVIGKTGRDGYGDFILAELQKKGVRTDGIVRETAEKTSSSVVLVGRDGERSFLHCMGANAHFHEADIRYDLIEECSIAFVAGSLLLPEFDGAPCAQFLKKAKKMGRITALDTAWDARGKWMRTLGPCMPYIDYFLPSYEEAVQLSGEREPEKIADVFLGMGVKTCAVKLGKDGCFIKDAKTGEKHVLPTYGNVRRVDTNGAGDAFCAGFLAGLIRGWGLKDCGLFANAVGTHCIMSAGASTGIRPMPQIIEFMKNHREELI